MQVVHLQLEKEFLRLLFLLHQARCASLEVNRKTPKELNGFRIRSIIYNQTKILIKTFDAVRLPVPTKSIFYCRILTKGSSVCQFSMKPGTFCLFSTFPMLYMFTLYSFTVLSVCFVFLFSIFPFHITSHIFRSV